MAEQIIDPEGFTSLRDEEINSETNAFSSAMAGVISGLIKVPEGVVSLGAELIDLGFDTDLAIDVEKAFDKFNVFEDIAPSKQSVLAAEKKARFLLDENATPEEIRAKTAEIIRNEMTGATYGEAANLQRAINRYANTYGDGSRAFNHAAFDVKVAPVLRAAGKNPRSNIKMLEDGSYKTIGKTPGVYIDVVNGKVIEFDGNIAKELPEYSAMLN